MEGLIVKEEMLEICKHVHLEIPFYESKIDELEEFF
jgi:hypothetical protein